MKNNNKMTNRLIVTMLSLLMLFSAGPFFFAENMSAYADGVNSWSALRSAINNGGEQTITLTKDIVAEDTITIPDGVTVTITGGKTIYSKAGREKYDSMFKVESGGKLTIADGTTLSGKTTSDGSSQSCPDNTYTADKFTGDLSADGKTYDPKGFFIHVEGGGEATLNGTISDFVTSRNKATTPRYVAPVVANGSKAEFNLGSTGVIKNNLVGYIVNDSKANNDAQTIKQYVKGAGPNVPRVPNAATQKANKDNFEGRPRSNDAGIDGGSPGTGITATAGAVIYKGGAKGNVEGTIDNNRADTGGIMVSGENSQVNIKAGSITNNVGVQFGGGSTAEQGGSILMQGGTMSKNVAWFGGGAVYATENGVDWLQGRMNGDDGLHPQFDDRKDGIFFMEGGELTENTAFTRGGAVLADSDGVNIQSGKLSYNMARMLGGAMYVMGDHPRYEYTVFMTKLYVHDNAAVSGESAARNATTKQPTSQTLADYWGDKNVNNLTWDTLNQPMQTLLQAPIKCGDLTAPILSGEVTGGKGGGNTDDYMDGIGAQGTGGGVWLCAYGNTVFEANEPDKVVITKNYATGAPKIGSGGYHKNLLPGDRDDANNNSKTSEESRSGITAGSDFHADTGGRGTVVINGLTETNVNWVNENTGEKYESTVSAGRLNLINKNEVAFPQDVAVEVVGNLARHGGGLAADGTFYFGTLSSQATPGATIEVKKEWINTAEKKPITIRATVTTSEGDIVLADVPLDGEANPPEKEFDTVQELSPAGNTWRGEFGFPMSVTAGNGKTVKLYTLVYTGDDLDIESINTTLTKDTELDPLSHKGRVAMAAVIEAGKADFIKVLFGEPVYSSTSGDFKKIAKEGENYTVTPITINYAELKENSEGNLETCDDYIFIPSEMNLADLDYEIHSTPKYKTTIDENGNIVETTEELYKIHLFSIPLTAPMSNDNWPLTEKYVNKKVHEDIVNFDQEFTYDIMAYVPLSATELTITDTLVNGLEFADKDGNKSTEEMEVVQSIVMKMANNHKTGDEGTVSTGATLKTLRGNEIDFVAWEKGEWHGQGFCPEIKIDGSTLTVKFDKSKMNPKVFEYVWDEGLKQNDGKWLPGRWVQITFNARIKDEYRTLDALKELRAQVDGKENSWEDTSTNKQAPDAKTISFANGDLGLVAALVSDVGPDPVIWAVEAPSRLFARTSNGDYYATPMDDKSGKTWKLIDKNGSETDFAKGAWENADSRYNGRPPYANNTVRQIDLEDSLLTELKKQPKIVGHKLIKGAEGGSRLFVQTEDANGNTHIFATPNNDKTGAVWEEALPGSDAYNNAVKRLKPDKYTVRMLDLKTETITLDGNGKNWPVISEEDHEGMANQGKYDVKFGNGASGTYKTNTVTVNPDTQELEATKKWVGAKKDEIPSPEDFASFLILKANNEDVTKKYKDKLTVKDNKDFTYTAKWVGLPNLEGVDYSYEVDEDKIPGFDKEIDELTMTITNTKTREEKPEIEKYVNQAVHKDIKLDEVFTYDIIAYITKDADSVTITDKLNDVLTFESKAEDIKVVDLGEDNNHLVTNNISNVKVNDNASVAQEGEPVDAAKVTVDGQDLKVFITNKMKVITEAFDPVEMLNPKKEGYYEKKETYIKTPDTELQGGKKYYEETAGGEYVVVDNPTLENIANYYELKEEYVRTQDEEVDPDKTYFKKSDGNYEEVQTSSINPKDLGLFEEDEDGYKETEDTTPVVGKTYYEKKTIDDGSRGYEYDGDEQPVTDLRGHWIKVTFNAKIKDGLKVEDVEKAFATIDKNQVEEDRAKENIGNAPVVSAENHTGIPNNAKYTIGVANEAGIQEDVYGDSSNTVTVKPKAETGDDDGTEPDDGDEDAKPDNDEEGDVGKDNSKVKGADTGDDTETMPWMLLFIASAAAATTGAVYRRKRSR